MLSLPARLRRTRLPSKAAEAAPQYLFAHGTTAEPSGSSLPMSWSCFKSCSVNGCFAGFFQEMRLGAIAPAGRLRARPPLSDAACAEARQSLRPCPPMTQPIVMGQEKE